MYYFCAENIFMRILFFVLLQLACVAHLIAQQLRPDIWNNLVVVEVLNAKQEIVPNIDVALYSTKDGKLYVGKTNSTGKAMILVPRNNNFQIKVNDFVVSERFYVIDKPYSTIPKTVTYKGPLPEFSSLETTTSTNDTMRVEIKEMVPDVNHVLIKIEMTDYNNKLLVNEKVIFAARNSKKTFLTKTNAEGKSQLLLPKGDFYDLHLQKQNYFTVFFLEQNERIYSKTIKIQYKGTQTIIDSDKEREAQILRLSVRIAELESLSAMDAKAINELKQNYAMLKNKIIRKYEDYSFILNDLNTFIPVNKLYDNKQIDVTFKGKPNAIHYIKPVEIYIKNISTQEIRCMIEAGRILKSVNPVSCDLLVTQKEMFVLQPGESETRDIYAMSIQKSVAASDETSIYKINELANEDLLTIARLINEKRYFIPEAQWAVWTLSDGLPIKMVAGFNSQAAEEMKFVLKVLTFNPDLALVDNSLANESSKNKTGVYADVDFRLTNYNNPKLGIPRSGSFEYFISKTSPVSIAMFNVKNVLVRELYFNAKQSAGNAILPFKYDESVYPDEKYIFKLLVNEELVKTITLEKP